MNSQHHEEDEQVIEVEPQDPPLGEYTGSDYESDSGFDGGMHSLRGSCLSAEQYIYENGRRYHSYFGVDKNLMPTDKQEQDRMDLHHEIMALLLEGEFHKSPLDCPHRILDVGTGTGIWAIDMADRYPMAEVIGVDLSPIQPEWVPPNCRFEVDDAEKPWLHKPDFFDFIHMRNLVQSIANWPNLMAQAYRCAIPGGWVELVESTPPLFCDDGSVKPDNAHKIYCDHLVAALEMIRRPVASPEAMVEYLSNAGFVDIRVYRRKQPVGLWPRQKDLKLIGAMCLLSCETGYEAYGMAFLTRILKMDETAAKKLCFEALEAVKDKNVHAYSHFYSVYGRKPEY